ncbi:MAG TPA: ABC transporter substrate-binding protein [Thermodesulfobacteriota bacterium]
MDRYGNDGRANARSRGLTRRDLVSRSLAAAAGLTLGAGRTRAARAAAPTINVGVLLPLSGANAQFGINARNGIELVADRINAAGGIGALGGATINLVVADATSNPATAATVAQRLITRNNVVAVLGAFASSLTLAVSEVTERRRIPLLTMSFSDQITGRGFKYVFQVVSKASVIGKAQFEYTLGIAKAAGETLDRVAIMYEDTAYGTSQATGLRAAAKEAGVEVVMDEAYPLGITDVTPLIGKLRASGARAVFPVSYLNDSILIIRTMRQQRVDIPAIGGAAGYVIPDFHRALGEYAEGVLSVNTSNYDLAPEETQPFRERYGYFMVHEAIEHAATMHLLARALETAKSDRPDAVREALAAGRVCDGIVKALPGGCVAFDQTGLNTETYPIMVQWRGAELVTVYPETVARAKPIWRS